MREKTMSIILAVAKIDLSSLEENKNFLISPLKEIKEEGLTKDWY